MLHHKKKHIHCIGIGGIGVSALAELLLARGYCVSGSDIAISANTERLAQLGIDVAIGHCAENIMGADSVIYSSAIRANNPELLAAEQNQITLLSRGAALAELVNHSQAITVAGTHGKTTTTSLLAHLFTVAGLDPSYVIGGILNNKSSPVHIGKGDYFIAEVDESDASFLYMKPLYTVITNVDSDHLDAYGGNFTNLQHSFLQYLATIPAHGVAFLCTDDPIIRSLLAKVHCPMVSYGFNAEAQVQGLDYRQYGLISEFNVLFAEDNDCVAMKLNVPGQHNAQNALAAIALAKRLGVSYAMMQQALITFPGVGRRFHGHGQMRIADGSATLIEDYGHHPREIKATLDAAKLVWPDRRVVLVFQPHRYTRTRDLYREFIQVLSAANKLYLLDIYSAGEQPLQDVNGLDLLDEITKVAKIKPDYIADLQQLPQVLYAQLKNNDVVILQGAGSIGSIAKDLKADDQSQVI